MSRFIDKLNRLSRTESQPIGFRTKEAASTRLKMQLVVSLAQENVDVLADNMIGADAGLVRISKLNSGVKALQKISQEVSDIPWGGWLPGGGQGKIKQITRVGGDFVVFSAINTPLSILQNDEVGKILEVEASIGEGVLRAVNELPVDAVLIADEQKEGYFLTWQHLMLFRRFADLLTKPLLVSVPLKVTVGEFQTLWGAGIAGVVVEVTAEQPYDRLKKLRQAIDKLIFPSPGKREKVEPLLSHVSGESGRVTTEKEEEAE